MALLFAKNNSLSAVTALPDSVSGGGFNLISTQTASSSSTISFDSNIDSTYKEYIFKFINIHPETDEKEFQINFSADGGSNYNVTKTTSLFSAFHSEADDNTGVTYAGSLDTAQGTGHQVITWQVGNDNDHPINGELFLFDPSSTTFVKHFNSRASATTYHNYERDAFMAGYFNTTSAINAIQFKMSSGNIDSGTIEMYGIS